MAMFTVASGSLLWGIGVGWSALTFRIFYLFGAILNVPWLALGTVELLAGPRWGRPLRRWLVVASAFAAGIMLEAPTRGRVPVDELPTGKALFGVAPRLLAGVASGVASLVLVGGALWSAWRLWRGRSRSPALATGSTTSTTSGSRAGGAGSTTSTASAPRRLAGGNVLIAVGTLILGASGTLNGRLGEATAFAVTLALGVIVLFAGFVVASSASVSRRRPVAPWLVAALGTRDGRP